jgi:protein-disulfide isomerase
MSIPTFPRESIEFLPITVTVDGVKVSTGVTFAKTTGADRPTVFNAAVTVGSNIGVMVAGEPTGLTTIYAKVTGTGETPVIMCGQYRVN